MPSDNASANFEDNEYLDPSELGNKEYWDALYENEISNHTTNPEDVGTIWFSDAGAEERVLNFLETMADEDILNKHETSFLDVGTGNGHFMFALRQEEWKGAMVGTDYSQGAIELARRIGRDQGIGDISFEHWNVMTEQPGDWVPEGGFDVVLDKGTFDAISLSNLLNNEGRRQFESYGEKIEKLIRDDGRFIVTSCNWTQEELKKWFIKEDGSLELEKTVKYPSFRFGGKEGSKVTTICFKKSNRSKL
jgi:EEF1A lysine methyltransferase 2